MPRLRAGRPMDQSYPQVYYISDIKVSLSLVSSHRKINSSNTDPGYDLLAILEDLDHVLEICVMLLIILNGVPIPSCDPDLYVLPMIKIVSFHNTGMCSRTRTSGGLHHTNNICAWWIFPWSLRNHHDRQRSTLANVLILKDPTNPS